ncbi:MAG TPA: aminotransferase class I/II-fold pyridoxal phosphate-dependent enzyme [Candidatus Cryosericum sp.]|nr:aminotransferase class I/II-fold pyridoxal phosphate-dependent enzyme [Candidatus Cryosericum sp.]
MDHPRQPQRIETLAVHSGERRPGPEGSIVFPIYQGTVFAFDEGTGYHDIKYIRLNSTPSQKYLHDKLAALEGAEAAVATSSGMAAVTSCVVTLLKAGDHILAGDTLYGGTHTFLTEHAPALGFSCTFVDAQRPETWKPALRPNTKAFLVETITNPLMRVPPLRQVVRFAKEAGLTTIIDNTFATPVNFRPLALGFDLAFHSATKYLNGHSDLVAGCVVGRAALINDVRKTMNHFGGTLDPHAGFLLARGMKTLALRVKAQGANATAVARFLAGHAKVAGVNYPGLETHPDHAHARELLAGFGGMLSIRLKGGLPSAERLVKALRIPTFAPSLGGVETLIIRPAATSHAGMKREEREAIGISEDLLRISCGIEAPEDLVEDFKQALEKA